MKTIFILLSFFSFDLQAQTHNGAISTAAAGSGRAAIEATDSPFMNPAALGFLKGYYFTSGYSGSTQKSKTGAQDFSLSVTDNMPETVVPTAITYIQRHTDFVNNHEMQTQQFGISFGGIAYRKLALGLTGRQKTDRDQIESFQQNNFTLGGVLAINDRSGVAVVFDNMVPAPNRVPEELRLQPNTSLAYTYNYKSFVRWKADITTASNNSFAKPTLSGGVESYLNRWLIMRAGIGRNAEKEANLYGAGLGFQGPKFGVHYGYLSSTEDQSLTRHSVDLAVPVW